MFFDKQKLLTTIVIFVKSEITTIFRKCINLLTTFLIKRIFNDIITSILFIIINLLMMSKTIFFDFIMSLFGKNCF